MAGRNAALIPCCKPRDRASSIGREARAPLRSQDAQGGPRAANCEPAAGCATAGICEALPLKVRFLGPGMPAILLPAAGRWGGLMSDDACGRTGCSVARPRRWSGLASVSQLHRLHPFSSLHEGRLTSHLWGSDNWFVQPLTEYWNPSAWAKAARTRVVAL